MTWAHRHDRDEMKAMVLTKLNAAKGGGYIFQSDHSVPSNVSGAELRVRGQPGAGVWKYPLQLANTT